MTRGADGLTIFTPAGECRAAAPTIDVADTVGAGDTIVGTVLASLWEQRAYRPDDLTDLTVKRWETIAHRAVAAAAITCSRPGADPPRRQELDW